MAHPEVFVSPPEGTTVEIAPDVWDGILDVQLLTKQGFRNPGQIAAQFYGHEYGSYLAAQPPRFSTRYGYDHGRMLTDLGPDADPIGHQMLTAAYIGLVIGYERQRTGQLPVAKSDVALLRLAGHIHDMGESMHPWLKAKVGSVLGDIPFGLKTDEQRALESRVRQVEYAELFANLTDETIRRLEAIISHSETSTLHDIYELAHLCQAFDTAREAGKLAVRRANETHETAPAEARILHNLSVQVQARLWPQLRKFDGRFHFTEFYTS